ncbi:hypothetical protein ACIRD8_25870 [Streptomyces sp. NPDC102451]|uniref:hypothetical protein n=1 Tax=Streptomyces sp. NPDC102451 TaxID=3366177 RepID=UPI00380EC60A
MSSSASRIRVVLEGGPDSDPEELESCTLALRERLLEQEIESVVLERAEEAPEGAKPGGTIALGALVVTAAPFVVRSLVHLLQAWIENRPVRRISIAVGEDSLEVEALSSADQRRLIEEFISRHTPPRTAVEPAPRPGPDTPVPESGTAGQV